MLGFVDVVGTEVVTVVVYVVAETGMVVTDLEGVDVLEELGEGVMVITLPLGDDCGTVVIVALDVEPESVFCNESIC